jgi:hypothetical protein
MRTITAAASTAATVALLSIPATAAADPHTTCRSTTVKTNYTRLYYKTARVHGPRTPGRNIRRHGMTSGRKSRCRDLQRSNRTFRRWLAPPPAPVRIVAQATTVTPVDPGPGTTVASAAPTYSGGQYAIPAEIVQCESGGDYNAHNPATGATGAYQILPSTAQAHGCDLSTPGGQDSCAATIMATEGRGAWSC